MHIPPRKSQMTHTIPQIIQKLKKYGQLNLKDMSQIVLRISTLLKNQPNLLTIHTPLIVVGDIHGQFYDLLNILEKYGSPENKQMLFLGDYVDRGSFSIEVITLLFVYKLRYPNSIHLLRGNHECRSLTTVFNFKLECIAKYNQTIYDEIMNIFDSLPICAVIDKKYFAVHGGISPNFKVLKEIQQLDRFQEIPQKGELCDLLWSDPISSRSETWKPNNVRQCSYFFGINQSKNFLNRNSLKLIIRGHQVEKQGYKYQRSDNVPLTLTIFSAPNYGDVYRNKGCIAQVTHDQIKINTYGQVQHPRVHSTFQNAIEWTIPLVSSCVMHAFKHILMLDNGKISTKIKDIMENKSKFKEDLELAEAGRLISKILSMDQDLSSKKQSIEKQYSENNNITNQKRQSFNSMRRTDLNQKIPFLGEFAKVIGPKISQSSPLFKELQSESDQSCQDGSLEMEYSLKVIGPTITSFDQFQ